jgi:acetyl-coA carboxylase, biotin carboxyl carrier protein
MDINFIRDLAGVMQEYNLNRLDYSCEDTKLELEIYGEKTGKKRNNILDNQNTALNRIDNGNDEVKNRSFVDDNIDRQSINQETSAKNESVLDQGLEAIQSNMIGTFYSKPSPDDEAFVQPGKVVNKDEVVCIIESMKLMNEIRAPFKCEIVEVLVDDGQIIEFGQDLFKVKNLEAK